MTASTQTSHSPMLRGIGYAAGAGAAWGLVFLSPELLRDFGPLALTVGRYLAYGAMAALLIAPRWRRLSHSLTRSEWGALHRLALTGNTLYYVLLASAVHMGGIAMTSLVIGFLPVVVTIVGSREVEAVPITRLLPSLLLCAGGAICIGWQALTPAVSGTSVSQITGLLCAVGALISWTFYAVSNGRWLRHLHDVSAHDWNLLVGVVTGLQAVVLAPFALALEPGHESIDWLHFVVISGGIALIASIVGNGLWNRMSRLLPMTLLGMMILFETLFALTYGFLWEGRWPTLLEAVAFVFVTLSVVTCIAAHRKPVALSLREDERTHTVW